MTSLYGTRVTLEPLRADHADALVAAARDGELQRVARREGALASWAARASGTLARL